MKLLVNWERELMALVEQHIRQFFRLYQPKGQTPFFRSWVEGFDG